MKRLYIDNIQEFGDRFEYGYRLEENGVPLISGFTSLPIVANETFETSLRKTCDQDIEILVDGVRIGVGAMNFGKGQTAEEFEHNAETPEADEESVDNS